jgi:hypothetical protein
VAVVFFLTIPGLAVILVALAAVDRLGWWLHGRSGLPWYRDGHRPAPAAGLDQFQAVFHSSQRHVIERRRAELMLRDDGHDGAPPCTLAGPGAGNSWAQLVSATADTLTSARTLDQTARARPYA